jgi:nucleoid DNA-binding protein
MMMSIEKPISMPIKNWIIRKLSVKKLISEQIIEEVVNFQFISASEALDVHKSLEFSGFGKLYFNEKRAIKKMEKYERLKALFEQRMVDESLTPARRRNAALKLETVIKSIEYLKPKLNGEAQ